jgi:hypothetical protein
MLLCLVAMIIVLLMSLFPPWREPSVRTVLKSALGKKISGQSSFKVPEASVLISDGKTNVSKYSALLERVKLFDRSVDFKELRYSYTETPAYKPYDKEEKAKELMFKCLKQKQYQEALTQALSILDRNYVDIEAHLVCRISYQKLNNPQKSAYHKFVEFGLIGSIMKSGDGLSPETAIVVITVHEEYIIMEILGLKREGQALLEVKGRHFDRLEVKDHKTGRSMALYFNVDIPMKWLRKSLQRVPS